MRNIYTKEKKTLIFDIINACLFGINVSISILLIGTQTKCISKFL